MTDQAIYRRGEVLLAELPFADITGSKVRPIVVVQNDIANKVSGNLIVVSVSARVPHYLLPTQYRVEAASSVGKQAGLIKNSVVDCSVIYTVAKNRIRRQLGAFPREAMSEIDDCLRVSLSPD